MILEHAIKITVDIQPTVTLRVITPIDNQVISQDKIDTRDKVCMEFMKEELKKTGRKKEVTLYGKKSCKELLTNHTLDSDILITVNCHYDQTGV